MKLNPATVNAHKSFLMTHGQFTAEQADLIIRAKAANENPATFRMEKSDDEAELFLYGDIGFSFWGDGITAGDFVKMFDDLDVKAINLRINSYGGDVFDGLAMHSFLKSRKERITTTVDGIAASAASIVMQAGDERKMVKGSMAMVHDAWGVAVGNAADMMDMAAVLEKIDGQIAGIYSARSGRKADTWRKIMDGESWFSDEEAVKNKLADESIDGTPEKVDAAALSQRFRNAPQVEAEESPAIKISQQSIAARLRSLELDGHKYTA